MQKAEYTQHGNVRLGQKVFKYTRGDILLIHSNSGHGNRVEYGVVCEQTVDYIEIAQTLLEFKPIASRKIEWEYVTSVRKLEFEDRSAFSTHNFSAQGLYDE